MSKSFKKFKHKSVDQEIRKPKHDPYKRKHSLWDTNHTDPDDLEELKKLKDKYKIPSFN